LSELRAKLLLISHKRASEDEITFRGPRLKMTRTILFATMLPSKMYSFLRRFIFSLLPTPHIPSAVMKLSKSGEAQSRDSYDYALRLCTKLPAKHPDMRLSNKVINEIDNFGKDIDQESLFEKWSGRTWRVAWGARVEFRSTAMH
jgi:hypothetical protein